MGMETKYLSPEYFGFVEFAVEEAKRTGLKVWLYDEGGWPSGSANGRIPEEYPEYQARTMILKHGRPEIRLVGNRTDLLNPKAVGIFLDLVYEGYRKHAGDHFGRTVMGIFTDEPYVPGCVGSEALPWTERMEAEFEKRKGYRLENYIPLLFAGAEHGGNDSDLLRRVRIDFSDVWVSLFETAYFRQIHRWCRGNNLLFTGHLGGEESLEAHHRNFGDFMRLSRYFDIPGIDTIARQIFPGRSSADFPKFASSIARLKNKRDVISESFAVYGWGLNFQHMKWITDYQYARGVTRLAPMAFLYSTRGARAVTVGSDLLGDPRFDHFKRFADYAGRLSRICRFGQPGARLGVYYPMDTLWGRPRDDGRFAKSVADLSQFLLARQYDFDYIDRETFLSRTCRIIEGGMKIGTTKYDTFIIPPGTCLDALLGAKLRAFSDRGGCLPAMDNGRVPLSQNRRVIQISPPTSAIRCLHRHWRSRHLFLLVNEKRKALTLDVRFPVKGEPTLWNPETGDITTVSAKMRRIDGEMTCCGIEIQPFGALAVGFGFRGRPSSRRAAVLYARRTIGTGWRLRPVESFELKETGINRITMHQASRSSNLGDWRKYLSEVFSGTGVYRTVFSLAVNEYKAEEIQLTLGKIQYIAEVRINGRTAGVSLWPPFVFDITPLVKKEGENVLEVIVTNTLANQMMSAGVKKQLRNRGWINSYFKLAEKFDQQSLSGGLFGPVQLLFCRRS